MLHTYLTTSWHSYIDTLPQDNEARQQLADAIATKNYNLAHFYAGEAGGW
jgi:hypothetical protein